MQLLHLAVALAFGATVAVTWLLTNRTPGFDMLSVFLYACIAFGLAWFFQLGVELILLYRGAYDGLAANVFVRYGAVLALHAAGGAIGLMGVIGVIDFKDEWWLLPAAAFATLLPLLVQVAAVADVRFLLFIVLALQAAGAVVAPVGYFLREAGKARESAALEAEHSSPVAQAEIERLTHFTRSTPVEDYFPFAMGTHARGIPELAAVKVSARLDSDAELLAALRGPHRYGALCLLAVEGVKPSAALAEGVRDAILAGAADGADAAVALKVAKRFKEFRSTLAPAMQKFR